MYLLFALIYRRLDLIYFHLAVELGLQSVFDFGHFENNLKLVGPRWPGVIPETNIENVEQFVATWAFYGAFLHCHRFNPVPSACRVESERYSRVGPKPVFSSALFTVYYFSNDEWRGSLRKSNWLLLWKRFSFLSCFCIYVSFLTSLVSFLPRFQNASGGTNIYR